MNTKVKWIWTVILCVLVWFTPHVVTLWILYTNANRVDNSLLDLTNFIVQSNFAPYFVSMVGASWILANFTNLEAKGVMKLTISSLVAVVLTACIVMGTHFMVVNSPDKFSIPIVSSLLILSMWVSCKIFQNPAAKMLGAPVNNS